MASSNLSGYFDNNDHNVNIIVATPSSRVSGQTRAHHHIQGTSYHWGKAIYMYNPITGVRLITFTGTSGLCVFKMYIAKQITEMRFADEIRQGDFK